MLQVYGTTLKALVHEKFGDGIISAINFRLDVKKVDDPEGGSRAVITLDGKYLPTAVLTPARRRGSGAAQVARRASGRRTFPPFRFNEDVAMDFVKRTIDLAMKNVEEGGRPFATVIVRDGEIVAESPNLVAQTSDPTARRNLAVRDACRKLGTEHLSDCEIYILARARCASVRCTTAARSAWFTSRRARTTRRSTATTASISSRHVLRRICEADRRAPVADGAAEARRCDQRLPALEGTEREVM